MAEIIFNKLVRDKIPSIIKKNGSVPIIRTLDEEEFSEALNKKLIEEVDEFLLSHNIEELVDIYEVLLAILANNKISLDEFEEMRNNKMKKNGVFEKKILLLSVEE